MKGNAIYLSIKEQELILEAIDMLECDYAETGSHSEQEILDKIKGKMIVGENQNEYFNKNK